MDEADVNYQENDNNYESNYKFQQMSGEDMRLKGMSDMQKQEDTFTMGEIIKDSNMPSALVSHAQSQVKINKVEAETDASKQKESQGTNGLKQSAEDDGRFIKSHQTEM